MRFPKTFLSTASIGLLLTASAKLLSAAGNAHILDFADPLLGIANRQVLYLIAAFELAIAGALNSRIAVSVKCLCAVWLGGSFLLYRGALALIKPGTPCKCLGTLTDWLHVDERFASLVLVWFAFYLLAGGLWHYFNTGLAREQTSRPNTSRGPRP
jgi:hypothetical protein